VHCRVVHVGSNANNGSNASVFTLNANNDSGNRNRNIGSHLAGGKAQQRLLQKWGEYVEPIALGRETEQRGYQQR